MKPSPALLAGTRRTELPCPNPHKTKFRDAAHAQSALDWIRSPHNPDPTPVLPETFYRCQCGSYHLRGPRKSA